MNFFYTKLTFKMTRNLSWDRSFRFKCFNWSFKSLANKKKIIATMEKKAVIFVFLRTYLEYEV